MEQAPGSAGDTAVSAQTIPAAFAAHVRTDPERTALIAVDGSTWSRGDLDRRSRQWAAALVTAGGSAGDRVVLSCAPTPETVAAYLGALRGGLVVVPANTGYTAREVAHIASDATPLLAIVDDEERARMWHEHGVTLVPPPAPDAAESTQDAAILDAPALIGYTSGTTGAPKGAVLTHANLAAGALSVVTAWEWSSSDRLLLVLPLFHMHGLGVGVNGTLLSGASVIVLPEFTTDAVFDASRAHSATMFFGVPTMYSRLARSPRIAELRTLRVAISGSAPLPTSVWERINEATGVAVLERYGMTETVMLTSNPLRGERRAGTVGLPLPGVDVRLGEGDVVEVRGGNVFNGYLGRPETSAAAFTEDGWFRTGDIGRFDADGYLSLVGRASELIISGGYNVYPREVEDVLRTHRAVADVAVVGTPDEEWGEIVSAYVVLASAPPGSDDDSSAWSAELAALARQELAPYKVPRQWHRLDALPRNAMGKVTRQALRRPKSP
jgi:malonyl-CoA/methylmalonyl-CoA synthetase